MRIRNALHRSYVPRIERMPYVRGRLDIPQLARAPWSVDPMCRYQEHTPDIEDNEILAWTLSLILRSGLPADHALPVLGRAHRALQGYVSLVPFRALDCAHRLYHRLNSDYQPLHALCRFFLDHTGPTQETGEHHMLPFTIEMAALFELLTPRKVGPDSSAYA